MNANHDPEAARSTCCFPVQIAYNFYCHGRNSSLMEARLILLLVLRPGKACSMRFVAHSLALSGVLSCFLLLCPPTPFSFVLSHHLPTYQNKPTPRDTATRFLASVRLVFRNRSTSHEEGSPRDAINSKEINKGTKEKETERENRKQSKRGSSR